MELELHQLELRHEMLRVRNARRERLLLASLSEIGQTTPVVVVHEGERFVLIDGYKRVRAMRALRHDIVIATEWSLGEAEALLFERLMRAGDADSAIEQGWFLHEMHTRFGLSQHELARRFARTQSWVSRRLALVEQLPDAVQSHVRSGAIGAHAAMKFLVPMARAKSVACVRLADALAPERPTDRQVGELYALWSSGSAKTREMVLSAPMVALRARDEAARSATLGKTAVDALVGDLAIVTAVARRVYGRVCDGVLATAEASEQQRIRHACSGASEAIETLRRRCDKEMSDARSEHADSHSQTA